MYLPLIGKSVFSFFLIPFEARYCKINFKKIQVDTYRQFTKLFHGSNVLHEDSFLRKHNQ